MAEATLHLLKLSVGSESVEGLLAWQAQRSAERAAAGLDPRPRHVTRMWPRRAEELLQGGSLYWVIRGLVLVRQPIEALEEALGEDGITRCAIILSPQAVLTETRPRRPFQGWRYLSATDAPRDLGAGRTAGRALPPELESVLDTLGVVGRSV